MWHLRFSVVFLLLLTAATYNRLAYNPDAFLYPIDKDGDCQTVDVEVLAQQSTVPVTWGPKGCVVVAGEWIDPFTGKVFTDPRDVRVTPIIAWKNAWESGALNWSRDARRDFANDEQCLLVIDKRQEHKRAAKRPDAWMPPAAAYHCAYLRTYLQCKQRYSLLLTPSESQAVIGGLHGCPE